MMVLAFNRCGRLKKMYWLMEGCATVKTTERRSGQWALIRLLR